MTNQDIRTIVERILKGLCRNSSAVEVNVDTASASSMVVSMRVHDEDVPRVIGRRGAHHRAIGQILSCIGRRHRVVITLTRLLEPVVGSSVRTFHPPFRMTKDWPKQEVRQLLQDVSTMCFGQVGVVFNERTDGHMDMIVAVEPGELHRALALAESFQALFSSIATTNCGSMTVSFHAEKPAKTNRG